MVFVFFFFSDSLDEKLQKKVILLILLSVDDLQRFDIWMSTAKVTSKDYHLFVFVFFFLGILRTTNH
jgi:hypothetical protein